MAKQQARAHTQPQPSSAGEPRGAARRPPIALVEVQGYVYRAKQGVAELYERAGDPDRAAKLRAEPTRLRERFNRTFWLEARGHYALALQGDKQPCAVLTSNPGQALWTGIVAEECVAATVERLLGADMFGGWGVRTLSTAERRYNPVGYHLGTVWPHDNAITAAGFRRGGRAHLRLHRRRADGGAEVEVLTADGVEIAVEPG